MKIIENCAALTIAASDSGGGAGIQADLKTFSALGVYGTSVLTAVTAQNLTEVSAIQAIDPGVVQKQLKAVLDGFPVKAIKTGMLYSAQIIDGIAETLLSYPGIPVIIDPVFAATSGSKLIRDEAIEHFKKKLIPLAALVTPNVPEAEILLGRELRDSKYLQQAAMKFFEKWRVPVLVKGGHLPLKDKTVDILYDQKGMSVYASDLVKGVNTHGSGCTLASAIAANMARGESLRKAVSLAKTYVTNSLKGSLQLLPDLRIINHFWLANDE